MSVFSSFSRDYCRLPVLQFLWGQIEIVATLASLCITTEVSLKKKNKGGEHRQIIDCGTIAELMLEKNTFIWLSKTQEIFSHSCTAC